MATGKFGGRGLKDRSLSESAGIRPYKMDMVFDDTAAFLEDKAADGENSSSAEEGDLFYDASAKLLKVHDGDVWVDVGLRYKAVDLSPAQVLATTGVELIPAETGKVHVVERAVCVYDTGGTGFTLKSTGDDFILKYAAVTGTAISGDLPLNNFLTGTADAIRTFPLLATAITLAAGESVLLDNNAGGAGSGGTGAVVTVQLWYRTIDPGL